MKRFLALDFETSGLDPSRHAPVSLGVALFDSGQVIDSKEWLIGPYKTKDGKIKREYAVNALEISGASWPAIKRAPSPLEVCGELNHFVMKHELRFVPVVAFNARFDNDFYHELMFDAGSWDQSTRSFQAFSPPLVGGWFCARLLAMHELILERYSLDSVTAHLGLSRDSERHGALEDAKLAGEVYARLIADRIDASRGAA